MMFTVTDAARAYFAGLLDEANAPEGAAVRISLGAGGFELQPDTPNEADATFDHAGRVVLVVGGHIAKALEGHTIDVQDTPEGPRLAMR